MEFLLIWIIFGVICAVVASNKGRSGFGWFLLGFLLGPLGLILALVVSKNHQALEAQGLQAGDKKKCPYCAELIKTEAVKCRYCGEALNPETPASKSKEVWSKPADDYTRHRLHSGE